MFFFFEDGPNVSISLIGYQKKTDDSTEKSLFPSSKYKSVSYVVNGKGIGDSLGDFSTVFLLSSLAYLYAPKKESLSSAVIGLGVSISAGILAKLEKIKDTTVFGNCSRSCGQCEAIPGF